MVESNQLPTILFISVREEQAKPFFEVFKSKQKDNFDSESKQWTISTKYYKADVQFKVIQLDALNDQEQDFGENVSAFVFFYDNEAQLSQKFKDKILYATTEIDSELSVLFFDGDKTKQAPMSEALQEQIINNSGFVEFIREDLQKQLEVSDQGENKAVHGLLHDQEKTGVDRLIEALECCSWPNMTQVKHQQVIRQDLLQAFNDSSLNQQKPEGGQEKNEQKESLKYEAPIKETAIEPVVKKDDQPKKLDEQEEQVNKADSDKITGLLETVLSPEEKDAESMISLMSEMQNMRLNQGAMKDDQRRLQAEQMMMKLAQFMDLDGGEDDEDDDGEDL